MVLGCRLLWFSCGCFGSGSGSGTHGASSRSVSAPGGRHAATDESLASAVTTSAPCRPVTSSSSLPPKAYDT
eukprot:7387635-Prymnesium_polylepis.1